MADITRRRFMQASAAAAATVALSGEAAAQPDAPPAPPPRERHDLRVIDYTKAKATPTVCFGCTTQCHVLGWVQDDKVVRISGNPIDPNCEGHICAKANGIIQTTYYPERLLYPLRRVGKRGEGKWKRITWEEAYKEIAPRLRKLMNDGRPDLFAIQVGRDKTMGLTGRFLQSIGSPNGLNRRSICSSNNRLGSMTYYGTTIDWSNPDFANTRYIINFGSNIMEAHQGGFGAMKRIQEARLERGAKLVTFEIRPSATASVSDEYHPVVPGTDGAIAMAMCHVIVNEGLADRKFWDRWCNLPYERIVDHLKPFTPEFAEKESGVKAADIRRIAIEFAKRAPRCTTLINRGIANHYNGIHSSRAALLLDILVGNVGKPGGFTISNRGDWSGGWGQDGLPTLGAPGPRPPRPAVWKPGMPQFDELPAQVKEKYHKLPEAWKAKYQGEFQTPVDYPLSWQWQVMKVGQMNYPWIKEGRCRVDTLFTYVFGGAYAYPEAKQCREVLMDEKLVPFHVCIDIHYSETAALADIILPEATALERWDAQTVNSWENIPLTAVRQPLTKPLGEAKTVWQIYHELSRHMGEDVFKYWDFSSEEDFYKQWYKNLPISWEEFKRRGIWWDPSRRKDYEMFERPVPEAELKNAVVDEKTGIVKQGDKVVGIMMDGKAVRGFPSPSRKIEVHQEVFTTAAKFMGMENEPFANPLPTYYRVPDYDGLKANEFKFVTFKWNVHTQGRSGHLKYHAEIVHSNPIWISAETAKKMGVKDNDWVEVTIRRPRKHTWRAGEEAPVGSIRNRVKIVPGVAPDTLACSHHVGHWEFGKVGSGKLGVESDGSPGMNPEQLKDRDIPANIWWAPSRGGVGSGVHVNDFMPINTTPMSGHQNWYDNVCTVRKL